MNIPSIWRRVTEPPSGDREGKGISAWGWSNSSVAEAESRARDKIRRIREFLAKQIFPDPYGYGEQPLREEIIRAMDAPGGEPEAVVTRNHYGAWVLNSARVGFVDIDFPPPKSRGLLDALRLAFVSGAKAERKRQQREELRERVRVWFQTHPGTAGRIYRTHAGLRVVLTHSLLDPEDEATLALMKEMEADRLYVQLTRRQGCFRARLSPKPWRVGLADPPCRFPRETPEQEAAFSLWLDSYEQACTGRSVCLLLDVVGPDSAIGEIQRVVALHDTLALRSPEEASLA